MTQHRLLTLLTISWLFLLFNIERMLPAVNIASFVYVLSTLAAASMLLCRPLRQMSWGASLIPAMLFVVAGKCYLGYVISWDTLPLTLLECSAVVSTHLLARRLGRDVDDFCESTDALVELSSHTAIPTISQAESALQQEIARARRTGRASTLVQIGIHGTWEAESLRRFLAQLTNDVIRKSAVSHVGRILLAETKVSDIVARDDEDFSLLLPETDQQQAAALVERLLRRVEEETGLVLRTRAISFPEDELTLEGLRDRIRSAPFIDEQMVQPALESHPAFSGVAGRVS